MYTGLGRQPFYCGYWVTYRCNSRCSFCNIWRNPKLQGTPDAKLEDVKRNLVDLKKMKLSIIDFIGGEPLLNPSLPEMLRYAKSLGLYTRLSTNGLLYAEYAEQLLGTLAFVNFSLEATTPEDYRHIRGIDGFDELLRGIQKARDLRQRCCLICTLTNETVENIKDIAAFCREQRIVGCVHPAFSYFGNQAMNSENLKKITKYFWHPYLRMSLPFFDFCFKGGNDPARPNCLAGRAAIDIGPDDTLITPCFYHSNRTIPLHGRLYDIFASSEWDAIFNQVGRYEFCQHCTVDCYFGMSYWDKIRWGFTKATIAEIKNDLEYLRPH